MKVISRLETARVRSRKAENEVQKSVFKEANTPGNIESERVSPAQEYN
jgi:hypothetical protein